MRLSDVMSLESLLNLGVQVDRHPKDHDREGAFSIPEEPLSSVSLDEVNKHVEADLSGFVMTHLAHTPGPDTLPDTSQLRLFCPGLNTAEPEASRRTGYLVRHLGYSLAHFHNGSLHSSGVNGVKGKLQAQRDWLHGFLVYRNLTNSLLGDRIEQLLRMNMALPNPQMIHATFYSDSTMAFVQAIRQMKKRFSRGRGQNPVSVAEFEQFLADTLFVELHGNGCFYLPKGPRYLIWTDLNDAVTFRKDFWRRQRWGRSAQFPDPDNDDAVYVDYEGPFTDQGFNAHNLQANGVHVVKETLKRNNCADGIALYEYAKSGQTVKVPKRGEVEGDASELW